MPPSRTRSRRALAAAALVLAALLAGMPAGSAAATGDTKAQEAAARGKLEAVKARIAELARQQRETSARRDDLGAALARQADTLAAAARAVRESDAALADAGKRLDDLDARRQAVRKRLDGQREALADLLRAAYSLGRGSDLRLLLGDGDIGRIARALAYSRYFQHDRVAKIRALSQDLTDLQALKTSIAQEQATLERTRAERADRVDALQAERTRQRALLKQAEAQLAEQGRTLQQLRQDQQRLDRLIRNLRDVFADIPRAMPSDTPFAKLRGHLPWPVRGDLARSGAGVRIDAARGDQVRAVAHGRVAYAAWLRGYGMLVIVDHGNGWMSLYGNNESLLRGVGDWVDAGDPVATAGVGANEHDGVYFELRHAGKPVDPRPWLAKRG